MSIYGNAENRLENREYYGWLEVEQSFLDQPVPAQFQDSTGKTWREYSMTYNLKSKWYLRVYNYDLGLNYRKDRMQDEVIQIWKDYFNPKQFLKWNEFRNLFDSQEAK